MTLKIRTWSLIAVLSALLPLIVFFIFATLHIGWKEQTFTESELRYRTSLVAQVTNERIATSMQALLVLGQSPAAVHGDWPALHAQAKRLVQSNPSYVAITLADHGENLLFVTTLPYGARTFKASYPQLLNEVFASAQPNVSGPFRVPIADGYRIAVSVPIVRNGAVTHVLRLILSTDSINNLLQQQELPDGWIAAITDRDGTLVARSVAAHTFVGKPASSSFRAAIQRGDGQIFQGLTLEGEPITSVVHPVLNGHWHAAIAVPDRILKSQSRRTMKTMLMISLCAAAIGIAMALFGSRFLAEQTRKLELVVASRQADSPASAAPVGISEFSGLYRSFRDIVKSEQQIEGHLQQVTLENHEVRDLYDHAPCGYHSLDVNGCIVRINQTELNWLGKTREEVMGQPFKNFFTEPGRALFDKVLPEFLARGHASDMEFELICADGSLKPVLINATLIYDQQGKPLMSRTIVFDITERKKLEQRLEELSNNDAMTGLCNRRHFYELARHEIERATRLHSNFALAILDVDHFKRVNDEFGHAVGDQLLTLLGKTLKQKLRAIDIPARVGGEEFALLLPHTDLASAQTVLDRLREDLAAMQLTLNDGRSVTFTVSIGVTSQQEGETDLDSMLSRADKALYDAKRLGRNRVCA